METGNCIPEEKSSESAQSMLSKSSFSQVNKKPNPKRAPGRQDTSKSIVIGGQKFEGREQFHVKSQMLQADDIKNKLAGFIGDSAARFAK